MDIKLYNSLSKKIEIFTPIKKGVVSMYVCGPTVYDYVHIGNLRPVVVFDVLRRLFIAQGYHVTYVSNYTDIDDKIINRALEENVSEIVLTEKYIQAFNDNVTAINSLFPDVAPKATDYITQIISFIDILVKKNAAYVNDGEVFFRVASDPDYGVLSNVNHEDLISGARVMENSKKENPADFLLWKKTEVGIKWDSPWGQGRPGWHTECVAMINDIFKQPIIDIHGGGFDLKFPHHENEIAQSQIYNGTHLANYWLHNGFINVDNQKMSKSLGNNISAREVLTKYDGNIIRMLLLSSHYRAPVNFSQDALVVSENEIDKLTRTLKQISVELQVNNIKTETNKDLLVPFYDALSDDLNTANALMVIYDLLSVANKTLRNKVIDFKLLSLQFGSIMQMLNVLGLRINLPLLDQNDIQLLKDYKFAKKAKDFAKSDDLRLLLQQKNIL
ncbi:MAG TPA: cysteine--tRNA ligase [Bacilli bacterium]|nr:cysteine--tRNA ligase [Bacilli bacterium]